MVGQREMEWCELGVVLVGRKRWRKMVRESERGRVWAERKRRRG